MTKGRFIDLVILAVNNGELTDLSSVLRADVRAYIPIAVNYAVMAGRNINLQSEGNRDYSSLFYSFMSDQPILVDSSRHNWNYVALPKGTIALPHNEGVRGMEDDNGEYSKPLSDNDMKTLAHYNKMFPNVKFHRLEGQKVYLFNFSPLTTSVGFPMIVDCDSLLDTDLLPIPAGLEDMAIKNAIDHFLRSRVDPAIAVRYHRGNIKNGSEEN